MCLFVVKVKRKFVSFDSLCCAVFSSLVCASATVGTVEAHPRSPARHRRLSKKATDSKVASAPVLCDTCAPLKNRGASRLGRRDGSNRKNVHVESCQRWTWSGSKCWHGGSNGSVDPIGRIFEDTANLENANKVDITATLTLRHHESLQKSMAAGVPAAARDAIAVRIETPKQAVYAKEPGHVQLLKVQVALGRAEDVAEKKQVAVWAAREAADKAVERVVNLRQRVAEGHGEDPHGRGRARDRGPVKLWRVARSWWFLVWLAVGSAGRWCAGPAQCGHARWRDGGRWDGSGESQGCSARFAAGRRRCPSGLGSCDGRAAKHRCGGNGFAAGSCVDDACGAEPVQTKPRVAGESVGVGFIKSVLPSGWQTGVRITLAQSISRSRTARTS